MLIQGQCRVVVGEGELADGAIQTVINGQLPAAAGLDQQGGEPSLPMVALTVRSARLMPAPNRKVSALWVFPSSTLPNPVSNS